MPTSEGDISGVTSATIEGDMSGVTSVGTNDAPNNNEQPPSSTWLICAHCGNTDQSTLRRCGRCKSTWYCSADHQRAHYPDHKLQCRLSAVTAEIKAQPPAVQTDLFHPHKCGK